jgi:hypothetical protein
VELGERRIRSFLPSAPRLQCSVNAPSVSDIELRTLRKLQGLAIRHLTANDEARKMTPCGTQITEFCNSNRLYVK